MLEYKGKMLRCRSCINLASVRLASLYTFLHGRLLWQGCSWVEKGGRGPHFYRGKWYTKMFPILWVQFCKACLLLPGVPTSVLGLHT